MECHIRIIVIITMYTEFFHKGIFSTFIGTQDSIHEEFLLCLETIITQHLTEDDSLLLLTPSTEDKKRNLHDLSNTLIHINGNTFVNNLLRTVHSRGILKIQTIGTEYEETDIYLIPPDIYVMLVTEEGFNLQSKTEDDAAKYVKEDEEVRESSEEEEYSIEELEIFMGEQLFVLQKMIIWNVRAKFIIIVDIKKGPNYSFHSLALEICRVLGKQNIMNIVVMVPNFNNGTFYNIGVDMFTWFPYKNGTCGEVENVIILDQWINRTFSEGLNMFPVKIPKQFNKCPIKLAAFGIEPFIVAVDNYTHNKDNGNTYNFRGLCAEYSLIALEELNVTVHVEKVSNDVTFDNLVDTVGGLSSGKYDVLVGPIPWIASAMILDLSFPTLYFTVKFQVPCSLPVPHTERILKTYHVSVWLTTLLTLVISSLVFYLSAKVHTFEESFTFKSVISCLCNTWAILMGVSVSEQPKSSVLRIFFYIYVCYCFSISTVFQTFFTSYLVEPGYGKPLRSLKDLLNSGFPLGVSRPLLPVVDTFEFKEMSLFKTEEFESFENASFRVITKGDMCMPSATQYAHFIACKLGIDDVSRTICFLEEDIVTLLFATALPKGSPLLTSFNDHIMRGFEAGFLHRYWSLFTLSLILSSTGNFNKGNNEYLVLNLSHLSPAFIVLFLGFSVSFVIFVLEIVIYSIEMCIGSSVPRRTNVRYISSNSTPRNGRGESFE
ncbi:Ionotropic receptor 592 [Blattella germanica]|nr:Ionotropic receptor 592 [Blattella germanica]